MNNEITFKLTGERIVFVFLIYAIVAFLVYKFTGFFGSATTTEFEYFLLVVLAIFSIIIYIVLVKILIK